jgi:hypothetical protein
MIPNCRGCKEELYSAFEYQELGMNVALEGMGKREHCILYFPGEELNEGEKNESKK